MQSKAKTVEEYLAELPDDRRTSIAAVRELIRKNLDKDFEEGMQYGMIGYYVPHRIYPAGYHCDPKQPLPFACLASQKNYMSLYMMSIYGDRDQLKQFQQAWRASGKKLNMGKSCVRFKKLDDLALDVIAEALRRVSATNYIEYYENTFRSTNRRKSKSGAKIRKSTGRAERPSRPAPRRRRPFDRRSPKKPSANERDARSSRCVERSAARLAAFLCKVFDLPGNS